MENPLRESWNDSEQEDASELDINLGLLSRESDVGPPASRGSHNTITDSSIRFNSMDWLDWGFIGRQLHYVEIANLHFFFFKFYTQRERGHTFAVIDSKSDNKNFSTHFFFTFFEKK